MRKVSQLIDFLPTATFFCDDGCHYVAFRTPPSWTDEDKDMAQKLAERSLDKAHRHLECCADDREAIRLHERRDVQERLALSAKHSLWPAIHNVRCA